MDALGHISATDAPLAFPQSTFAQLYADIMGNAGDPDDGFDSALTATANNLATIQSDLDAIDIILGLGILLGDPTGDSVLAANDAAFQDNIANVNADLDAFNNLALAVGVTPIDVSAPDPNAPQATNVTSSFCQAYEQQSDFLGEFTATATGQKQTLRITWQNTSGNVWQTVYPVLIANPQFFFFFTIAPEPGRVQPGETVTLGTLTFTDTGAGLYCCQFQLSDNYDQFGSYGVLIEVQ